MIPGFEDEYLAVRIPLILGDGVTASALPFRDTDEMFAGAMMVISVEDDVWTSPVMESLEPCRSASRTSCGPHIRTALVDPKDQYEP